MKQHNHWKTQKLLKFISSLVLWGLGITLFLGNIIFHANLTFDFISTAIGIISSCLGTFLFLLEKNLWKTKLLKLPIFEKYWTPVLEGRWKGTLTRDKKTHDFVIEITQSFSSISCTAYSTHSTSTCYAAKILYNETNQRHQLIFYWLGKTTNVVVPDMSSEMFHGFTVLDIIIEKNVTTLKGEYFTDRQPHQTRGTIELAFQQKELKNAF